MSDEKQCSRCSKVKPLDLFVKKYTYCKECRNVYLREHRRTNRKRLTEKQREYRRTDKGRQLKQEWKSGYAMRNPEKDYAHRRIAIAINLGWITRQPCEVCGVASPVEAHHDDYSKPLEVRWLCSDHHREHHRAMKNR